MIFPLVVTAKAKPSEQMNENKLVTLDCYAGEND